MYRLKIVLIYLFAAFGLAACFGGGNEQYSIASSRAYEASLFRQNCAICHGPEGEGKTIDDGTVVPSLRHGDFKAISEDQIYSQIADGGNGMTPFRTQLTEREIRLLVKLVREDLRKGN
ncbi:MAG: cytochrome c [Acidobacteria bacterium]|nr:cytochrome c [Acidobacteriota bacterium]